MVMNLVIINTEVVEVGRENLTFKAGKSAY